MTDNIKAIDFNGVKIKLDSNTVLIQLKGNSVNGTVTLNDTRDATKYSVPASKKAHLIFITTLSFSGTDKILFADDEDGTTNAVTLYQPAAVISSVIFVSEEIPAGKFINITDTAITAYEIFIVEESA